MTSTNCIATTIAVLSLCSVDFSTDDLRYQPEYFHRGRDKRSKRQKFLTKNMIRRKQPKPRSMRRYNARIYN